MNNKVFNIIAAICVGAGIGGCGALNTDLSIAENPIPETFDNHVDQTSIAEIDWRDYFSDPQLLELVDTAIRNNFDLQIALQRIETNRASVKLANGALLPQVGLDIGGGVRKFGLYTMDGAGNASTEITPGQTVPENLPDMYLGLMASWEIDVWGKLRILINLNTDSGRT
ncbi:MAG: TolC family protein [Gammaproteobacteria bacterium]|nr:TolC family protein [Gammaproteobacteria bacterium]